MEEVLGKGRGRKTGSIRGWEGIVGEGIAE